MDSLKLRFEVPTKEVLNANSLPNHFIVKGKMAAALRAKGSEAGLLAHPDTEAAKKRFDVIREEEALKLQKSRRRKAMNKLKENDEAIDAALLEIEEASGIKVASKDMPVSFPFQKFTVDVIVSAPTRRRFDPPNLYPSVKPIIDGLTDASLWEDDSFDQLTSMTFRAGELSGVKGTFAITLDIRKEEADES